MSKVSDIKALIDHETQDLPTGQIGIGRKELSEMATERFGYTTQQVDNVLSYIRTVDPQSDPETWWFTEVRRNKYVYHPPVKLETVKIPVGRAEIPNDLYPTDEVIRGFKKEEMFKLLNKNIEAVVAVDGNFNTRSTRDELVALTLKVVKYLRKNHK